MARTDDDKWDITKSVGATAFSCAEWRAREVQHEPPLFSDPYAQFFVDAATAHGWSSVNHTDKFPWIEKSSPQAMRRLLAFGEYISSRTRWFDDFFSDSRDNVTQVVLLASGLDARAWRLRWTSHTTVYEIDQPEVLAFKTETLQSHNVDPTANWVGVPADLRQDWPRALCDSGFDPGQPTAWSVEGLLPYLPGTGQDLLFEQIHEHSASGSRIAVDVISTDFYSPENVARRKSTYDQLRDVIIKGGGAMVEYQDLVFDEQRSDVCDWLRAHRWQVAAIELQDVMAQYHREVPAEDGGGIPQCLLVSARLAH